jgi:hypothetical protein
MNKQEKIEQFVLKRLDEIARTLIIEYDTNRYRLFDRYTIVKNSDNTARVYYNNDKEILFRDLKIAVSWVIFHNKTKMQEAERIAQIDSFLVSIQFMKNLYKRRKRSKKLEDYLLFDTKLQRVSDQETKFLLEMTKYINMAYTSQIRGFENETKRSQRK